MDVDQCMPRKAWTLPFLAEPEEVAALRRIMRLHLGMWGLPELVDTAQLCVSELVANVIVHVGAGTPTTLAVSMNDTFLRIEIHDPDTRVLPTLLAADTASEQGRGIALVDAVTDRWGVILQADSKITWCELGTTLDELDTHTGPRGRTARAEVLLHLYGASPEARDPLSRLAGEEAAIEAIGDFLHWLHANGCSPGLALGHAKRQFEADLPKS
ncbi:MULTISPECIES: ATP-binding protein [unclassified Streptomyces]|uniref:ATP-binding protein n=1 Tax=Streptomyces sp. NBC_00060 TaxID=2975636 RepID=A0AAU2H5B1_9ACTN